MSQKVVLQPEGRRCRFGATAPRFAALVLAALVVGSGCAAAPSSSVRTDSAKSTRGIEDGRCDHLSFEHMDEWEISRIRSEVDLDTGDIICMWRSAEPTRDLEDERFIELLVTTLKDEGVAEFRARRLASPYPVKFVDEVVDGRPAFTWWPPGGGASSCNVLFADEALQVSLFASSTLQNSDVEVCRRARLHAIEVSSRLDALPTAEVVTASARAEPTAFLQQFLATWSAGGDLSEFGSPRALDVFDEDPGDWNGYQVSSDIESCELKTYGTVRAGRCIITLFSSPGTGLLYEVTYRELNALGELTLENFEFLGGGS